MPTQTGLRLRLRKYTTDNAFSLYLYSFANFCSPILVFFQVQVNSIFPCFASFVYLHKYILSFLHIFTKF